MTNRVKKLLAIIIVAIMAVSVVPLSASAGTNGHTQAEALNWLNQKIGTKVGTGQCVDLAQAYYSYLGYSVRGNGKDYANNVPSGWTKIPYSKGVTAQPGDIVVWNATNSSAGAVYGHVAIVHSADSVAMNIFEQGASCNYKVKVNWLYYEGYGKPTCFIRPDFVPPYYNPEGVIDIIEGREGCIRVKGWCFDKDDLTKSLMVHVYIGGSCVTGKEGYQINGNVARTDVDSVYRVGAFHGFDSVINTNLTGNQEIYIYAINIGGGNSTELGHKTVYISPKHTHSYSSSVTTQPTCTGYGVRTYKCSCGSSYTERINPKGHTDGEWKVTKEATYTQKGVKTQYCSVCKAALRTAEIPIKSHGIVKSVDISDINVFYKGTSAINPNINIDSGVNYSVSYKSSDAEVVTVDEKGNIYGVNIGEAEITCTVRDEFGNVVTDKAIVTVDYSLFQWFIIIALFGWIWYI